MVDSLRATGTLVASRSVLQFHKFTGNHGNIADNRVLKTKGKDENNVPLGGGAALEGSRFRVYLIGPLISRSVDPRLVNYNHFG